MAVIGYTDVQILETMISHSQIKFDSETFILPIATLSEIYFLIYGSIPSSTAVGLYLNIEEISVLGQKSSVIRNIIKKYA